MELVGVVGKYIKALGAGVAYGMVGIFTPCRDRTGIPDIHYLI